MTGPRVPTNAGADDAPPIRRRVRLLYVRVLIVQALTLLTLWLLQAAFGLG